MKGLLVANRGEVAIRIFRAAAELGIPTAGVFSRDDDRCLHVRYADAMFGLDGNGPAAYLDAQQMIRAAQEMGCDAIHPGYGFLSESPEFALLCNQAGMRFVGPSAETLALFGNKAEARKLASRLNVPILEGTDGPTTIEQARELLRASGKNTSILLKAVAGGGGRGVRLVHSEADLPEAFERAQSEAAAAFGDGELYAERFLARARHIEVQVAGDGSGEVVDFGVRDCSIQRRFQKVVEVAPSARLPERMRRQLTLDACKMAREVRYKSIGTFEFLLNAEEPEEYVFIEANPRLQVEHTVTEEVFEVDLVQIQLRLANGETLSEVVGRVDAPREPKGFAVQFRVNMETLAEDGSTRPSSGVIRTFDLPTGPGVRVESLGYTGYEANPRYDSLLAKVVVHSRSTDFADVARRASRALADLRIEGVQTNLPLLRALVEHPAFASQDVHTRFLEELKPAALGGDRSAREFFHGPSDATLSGAVVSPDDPLAVLAYGQSSSPGSTEHPGRIPDVGDLVAPLQGAIVTVDIAVGDSIRAGQQVMVIQAMKMEHVIRAAFSGIVRAVPVRVGDVVAEGSLLLNTDTTGYLEVEEPDDAAPEQDAIPASVAQAIQFHDLTSDTARADAAEKRHSVGKRTTRENIADLADPGSFVEFGSLMVAGGVPGSDEELLHKTPGDGLVAGLGLVNGDMFPEERARAIVMSYDYTVFAGTQGGQNHRKHDRMFEIAEQWRVPLLFFTEGGGGRAAAGPLLTSAAPIRGMGGLRSTTFWRLARLSGLVPMIAINSGRCFAGNAAILGCCDVVIATADSTIGMGGPAMIEGGGLGVFRPEEVGPMHIQTRSGVVDIAVPDEQAAVAAAKHYLSFFQGRVESWQCADQALLRNIVPENRLRAYEVRRVIETMSDIGSWLELRRDFGRTMITGFLRVEGRPVGLIANDPVHLGGAIDSDGADKAARFMQLCDAFDIPLLSLCDTPGIMVGPESEKTGAVRHSSRMLVTAANVTVPFMTIVLRKAYGLGALAMGGSSFQAPMFAISWPSGEFGGMGLEGMVKLGFRDRLAAIDDLAERRGLFESLVAAAYERGKAVNSAMGFEVDDVIDPADTRRWITAALRSVPPPLARTHKKRPNIDTW